MEAAAGEEQQLLQQEDGTFLLQQPDGTYVALTEEEVNSLVEQGVLQVQEADDQLPDSTTTAVTGMPQEPDSSSVMMNQQPVISSSGVVQSGQSLLASNTNTAGQGQATPQLGSDTQIEIPAVNMDKVQRIQSQLPVQDPGAPLGSSKNPIRIIQQGSQYIVTQHLSDEQMKQIMQVLQNQQLLAEAQTGPHSTVYNPDTNTRIIFRVTQTGKQGRSSAGGSPGSAGVNRKSVAGAGFGNMGTPASYYSGPMARRGRPPLKRRMEDEDPDFDPRFPDSKTSKLTSSGRISRPPRHMIKDYKTIPLESLDDDVREEDSDGGYSDFKQVSDEENAPEVAGAGDMGGDAQTLWECDRCAAQFATRHGLNRHIAMKHEGKRIPRNHDNAFLLPLRRRNALKNALVEASDDEVVDICLPRLAKLVTPFDYLLVKSEKGDPHPMPNLSMVTEDLLNLLEICRAFLQEHLVPSDDPQAAVGLSPNSAAVNVDSEAKAVALGIPCGQYAVKQYINEGYLPSRHRNIQARSGTPPPPHSMLQKKVEVQTANVAGADIVNRAADSTGKISNEKQTIRVMVPPAEKDAANAAIDANGTVQVQEVGKPVVTDADIESGRFVQVLDEEGQPSELVIEAHSGQLLNRYTGEQITMLEDGCQLEGAAEAVEGQEHLLMEAAAEMAAAADEVEPQQSAEIKEDVEVEEEKKVELEEQSEEGVADSTENPQEIEQPADSGSGEEKAEEEQLEVAEEGADTVPKPEQSEQELGEEEAAATVEKPGEEAALEEAEGVPAEEGEEEAVDLATLFPGVTISDVDAATILITKPDGTSLQVEHGGNGITLETLQALMQMEC